MSARMILLRGTQIVRFCSAVGDEWDTTSRQ